MQAAMSTEGVSTRIAGALAALGLALAGALLPPAARDARADEGRFAIHQPTTISQPGSYVLNRDIVAASGDALVIQASDVDLDLNGYAVRVTSEATTAVHILDGQASIRIRNGRILGDGTTYGVIYGSDQNAPPIALRLENLEIINHAFSVFVLSASAVQVVDSDVSRCSVRCVLVNGAALGGRIADSRMADADFSALSLFQSG